MDHIASMFVRKLAALIADETATGQTRVRAIYERAGLDATAPPEQQRTIPASNFFDVLEFLAMDLEGGRAVGVHLGASMRCDDYGAFGLAFKSAPDLLGSFSRVERYGRVVTSVANYRVEPGPQGTFMAIDPGKETRLGQRMTNELAVAAGTALCREVSREAFTPAAASFSHERPADLSAYEDHFRCPLNFGANRDGFSVDARALAAGNQLGDAGMSAFFDAHLDRALSEFVDDSRLDQKVCSEISRALSEGVPTIGAVAGRLGMSGRTLQRRLAEDGQVFQDLLEQTRCRLAERLLRQTDYALAEIAFLTGYSEQSTFSRAFKRLSGQTPASFRREAVSG